VGGISITNVATLTPEGITYRYNFRRKTIPWEAVDSFKISASPANPIWSTVQVELRPVGHQHIKCLFGGKRYIRRIITELEAYHRHLGATPSTPGPT